jgi:hypothetical protein
MALLAACGTTSSTGECKDYKPLIQACMSGTFYQCTRTADGCEQCSCVPGTDDGRAPLPDDRR